MLHLALSVQADGSGVFFSRVKERELSESDSTFTMWSAWLRSFLKKSCRFVLNEVASENTTMESASGASSRKPSSECSNDARAGRSCTSSSKYKSGKAVTISTSAENVSNT